MKKAQQPTSNISLEQAEKNVLKEMNKLIQTPQLKAKKEAFENAITNKRSSERAQSLLSSFEQARDASYESLIQSLKTLVTFHPPMPITVVNSSTIFQNSNNLSNNNNQNSNSPLSTILSTYELLLTPQDKSNFFGQQNIDSLIPFLPKPFSEEHKKFREITKEQKNDKILEILENSEWNQIYQNIHNQNLVLKNLLISLEEIVKILDSERGNESAILRDNHPRI